MEYFTLKLFIYLFSVDRIVLLVLIIGSLGSQWTAIAFPLEDELEGRQSPPLDLQHLSQEDVGALIHRLYPNFPLPASTTKAPYSAPGTIVPLVAAPPPATYPGLTNPDTYQPDPSAASTGSAPIITNDVAYSNLCFNSRFCLVPVFLHAPQEGLA